ncbi:hypothetical protein B0F90DRAFT_1949016 [Multifurca ochricompacta]|uniref:RRM domain-containing protein n=1 Tax=Multifurca ochricompacta TaxID=376703 RepID=A0AAD4M6W3_9AGAM|nr:hypothetical protein B0F90DRAFT_1949016 [Multifurca ochricompacta]
MTSDSDPPARKVKKTSKPKLVKAEDHFKKSETKNPAKEERAKPVRHPKMTTAREMRHKLAVDVPKRTKRATRSVRKLPGPWRAPSSSPSLSPASGLEPSHSEPDEPEALPEGSGHDEENVHLYGFSTDEDSSDDDLDAGDGADFDMGALPTVARDDMTVKRKLEKAKRKIETEPGVIYLGRIPHGFYEDQLRAYFSQFGEISRLRLSRNKRTGRSKHYGFIEFVSAPVAQIVAETMDNYLLMGHILTCKVIPNAEVHPELWVGANRKWRVVPGYRLAQAQHNKPRDEKQQRAAEKRLIRRQAARKRKLAEAGIVYNFDKVEYKKPKSVA